MNNKVPISYEKVQESAVLIGVILPAFQEEEVKENLDELAFLADTAGAIAKKTFIQKLSTTEPDTFIGSGKLEQVRQYISENQIDLAIFDDELSPGQQRNIEKVLDCRVLDRTSLILDIFASRAKTSYAKIQVELAQYEYILPRLKHLWTHLERQKGGIGLRGPGEKELETDRRIIRDKISLLKEQLKKIDKQMATQRGNRGKLVRVALVGYTNV
ncbi:MAG: GTPase HflX, partial [Bacteroidota bacterium]|nr:GTPase HflX [Bacteroidota bacterium]